MFLFFVVGIGRDRTGEAHKIADITIKEMSSTIARRRAQLIYTDNYDMEHTDKWEKEKFYIASSVIPAKLRSKGVPQNLIDRLQVSTLQRLIEAEAALTKATTTSGEMQRLPASTGAEYEQYCAEILRKAGWKARVTAATGDQGADIVAERHGRRVILQCKLYSKPVGNKAVQEVVSAKIHEQADEAVVVSNTTFTKSARQLANTTGARLLHHDELSEL